MVNDILEIGLGVMFALIGLGAFFFLYFMGASFLAKYTKKEEKKDGE